MSHALHLVSNNILGYGPTDCRYLSGLGISRRAVALSPCSLLSDHRICSQVNIRSLKCGSKGVSFVCRAGNKRNSDFSRQRHGFRGRNRQNEDRENFENPDESEMLSSKNGRLASHSGFTKHQATAAPGQREKEILELFRLVQSSLRESAAAKEDKKTESVDGKGEESENVDSLLRLLRKHSDEPGAVNKKNSFGSSRSLNLDHPEVNGSSYEDKSSSLFGSNNRVKREAKETYAPTFSRPPSNFRRKSPVQQMKYQQIYSSEEGDNILRNVNSDRKNNLSSAESSPASDDLPELDEEPESEIEPESIYQDPDLLDEFSEDESADVDEDNGEQHIDHEDLSALKLTELRALAKSRGLKGISRMKKSDLILDTLSQKQSKDELLYQAVNAGSVNSIKTLCSEGAGLEWIDKDGKTPLVVACMNPELIDVAKTLIELGANVNAYRPGLYAGTPLHHAAKRGLEQTVKLLLSHGANALLRNDHCRTPLEVARIKGCTNVVRAIENHICSFSGWLREFRGPGFLGGFAPQLLSRKIWVVILPCGSGNPMKPPRFELAIYSTLQDAQPRTVIALWKAKIEEPQFHKSDPAFAIFDQSTKTRYKLASGNEGDKQQLQWLYSACKGIMQVFPSKMGLNTQTSSAATAHQIAAESAELNNNQSAGVVHANGWENSENIESYNGWGPAVGQAHSELGSNGWMDEPTRNDYNGWGLPDSRPTSKQSHHVQTPGDHSGWMDVPTRKDNDWAVPDTGPTGKQSHHNENPMNSGPLVQTGGFSASISPAPSAPPIPEDVLGAEPIQYPSLDLNPMDLPVPATTTINYGASTTNDAKEGAGSSSCIICWEAPAEGACIPCGHMAGCMSCLNEIKTKKGLCPVCRGKIDQIIRVYAV